MFTKKDEDDKKIILENLSKLYDLLNENNYFNYLEKTTELINKFNNFKVINTKNTYEGIVSLISSYIDDTIDCINNKSELVISNFLTLQYIINDAYDNPLFYNDIDCFKMFYKLVSIKKQQYEYTVIINLTNEKIDKLNEAYQTSPNKFDNETIVGQIKNLDEEINKYKSYLSELERQFNVISIRLNNIKV